MLRGSIFMVIRAVIIFLLFFNTEGANPVMFIIAFIALNFVVAMDIGWAKTEAILSMVNRSKR